MIKFDIVQLFLYCEVMNVKCTRHGVSVTDFWKCTRSVWCFRGQDSKASFVARVKTPPQVDTATQQKSQKPNSTQLHNKSSSLYTYTNIRLGYTYLQPWLFLDCTASPSPFSHFDCHYLCTHTFWRKQCFAFGSIGQLYQILFVKASICVCGLASDEMVERIQIPLLA